MQTTYTTQQQKSQQPEKIIKVIHVLGKQQTKEKSDHKVSLNSSTFIHNLTLSKNNHCWHSHLGSAVTNLTSIHEDADLIPGLDQWVKDHTMPWAVVQVTDTARIPTLSLSLSIELKPSTNGPALKHKASFLYPDPHLQP